MRSFFKITALTGLLTLLRMLVGIIVVKVVSITTGPTGLAMLGQIQSLVTSLSGIVNAPAGNGVVRFTAQYQNEGYDACSPWWRASLQYVVIILAIIIPTGIVFSEKIAIWLLEDIALKWVVVASLLALPITAFGTLGNSVLNGQQNYRRYVSLGMLSVLVSGMVMLTMIITNHVHGALLAAAIQSGVIGLVVLFGIVKEPWFKLRYWWGKTTSESRNGIAGYMLMAVTSALTMPVALMIVRNILVQEEGWELTGQWQAVWKISEIYLSVITIALSTYYLPRLSSMASWKSISSEASRTAILTLPFILIFAVSIFLSKDLIIKIIFTESFNGAIDLFSVQLVGDVVKILGWIYAYPMIAKGEFRWFITFEIILSCVFVFLSIVFINEYGVNGACIAYLATYVLYLIVAFIFLRTRISREI